jgi:recombination protein RecR
LKKADYPADLHHLIAQLKRLPGVGPRGAERMALWLIKSPANVSHELSEALREARDHIQPCPRCGFFSSGGGSCDICQDSARDTHLLCVLEQATDVLPVERSGAFRGFYHCLGGRIAPLDHIGPEDLRIPQLLERLRHAAGEVHEVILALNADVEGEATANYLAGVLSAEFPELQISRIAQGLPAGGGLDNADEITLSRALAGRVRSQF